MTGIKAEVPKLDAGQSGLPHARYAHRMFRPAKYVASNIGLLAAMLLFLPSALRAEEGQSENAALLAISRQNGYVAAGMMCNGTESGGLGLAGRPSQSMRFDAPNANMCRRSSSSMLNPNVLAFDVTLWPRQAIAELAGRVRLVNDPLNYDFSKVRIGAFRVRRIEEIQGEDDLSPPTFAFSFGCYLLMIVPDSKIADS